MKIVTARQLYRETPTETALVKLRGEIVGVFVPQGEDLAAAREALMRAVMPFGPEPQPVVKRLTLLERLRRWLEG